MSELFIFSRFVHFVSLFFILASSLYCAYLSPPEFATHLARRLLYSQKLISVVICVSSLSLCITQAAQVSDNYLELLHMPIWLALLSTEFGLIYALTLLASLILSSMINLYGNSWQKIILLIASILLLSCSFIGHTAMRTGVIGTIQRLNQMVHLFCAAYWAGGLVMVLICLSYLKHRIFSKDALLTIMRFSYLGHYAVILVILTGIVNGYLIMGIPVSFNSYNILLLIKFSLVGFMVIIALYNRYVLVPSFKVNLKSKAAGIKLFITTTLVELCLSIVALALVSFFATFSPS